MQKLASGGAPDCRRGLVDCVRQVWAVCCARLEGAGPLPRTAAIAVPDAVRTNRDHADAASGL
jgi:hypothetical protein